MKTDNKLGKVYDKKSDILPEKVRVLRLIQYEGYRPEVEQQIRNSIDGLIDGSVTFGNITITVVTLDQFPEVLEKAKIKSS